MLRTGTGRVLGAIALSLMLSSVAFAQRPGGGFGRGGMMFGGGANLLGRPEVQADLKLTDAQKTQVTDMLEKQRADHQGLFQSFQGLSQEERQKKMAEMQAADLKAINAILNEDQQKRFKQISLQAQGPMALATPAVADELKLTDDQKAKVASALQAQQTAMQDLMQSLQNGGDRQAAGQKMQAIRGDTNTKLEAILTDSQKAQWKDMLGTLLPASAFAPNRPRGGGN